MEQPSTAEHINFQATVLQTLHQSIYLGGETCSLCACVRVCARACCASMRACLRVSVPPWVVGVFVRVYVCIACKRGREYYINVPVAQANY